MARPTDRQLQNQHGGCTLHEKCITIFFSLYWHYEGVIQVSFVMIICLIMILALVFLVRQKFEEIFSATS